MLTISTTAMRLSSHQPKPLSLIILVTVLLAAFFLRTWPTLSDTTHFSFDQGLDMIMAKLLIVDHQINLISRHSGLIFWPPLLPFQVVTPPATSSSCLFLIWSPLFWQLCWSAGNSA